LVTRSDFAVAQEFDFHVTLWVADVAFIGNTMYAILAGAGCSHGVFISPGVPIPNGVIRINPDHTWTMIANLSTFQQTHPVANPTNPITGDFEPDGTCQRREV
jgi:hypothetical protein